MSDSSKGGADKSVKAESVLSSNMLAAKGIADVVRTSLGPRGMDKMITGGNKETTITNDGATMLAELQVAHPCAKMFVEMSHAQDVEAGDGTTTVVVIAGALLQTAQRLVTKGFHPNVISRSFGIAMENVEGILQNMSTPIKIGDTEILIKNCETSLASKMIKDDARQLSEISVEAVLSVLDTPESTNVDLKRIKIITQLGSPVSDSTIVKGLILSRKVSHAPKAPTKIDNASIGLIQFCISPPKTDMDSTVVVGNVADMDRAIKKERDYILGICKKIKAVGINVLLVQKSILRDALDSWALNFLGKMGIMVMQDIERDEVDFVCHALNCIPIASVDQLKVEKLAHAERVEEISSSHSSAYVKFSNVAKSGTAVSILCCAPNKLMLEEAERSFRDSLCVARSLVKKRYLLPGGGAAETELAVQLAKVADTISGLDAAGVRAFADAMEVVPLTLAENNGMDPIKALTELRKRHAQGDSKAGVHTLEAEGFASNISFSDFANTRTTGGSDISTMGGGGKRRKEVEVVQPLLVSLSAVKLATETVRQILRIDDIIGTR